MGMKMDMSCQDMGMCFTASKKLDHLLFKGWHISSVGGNNHITASHLPFQWKGQGFLHFLFLNCFWDPLVFAGLVLKQSVNNTWKACDHLMRKKMVII